MELMETAMQPARWRMEERLFELEEGNSTRKGSWLEMIPTNSSNR
jgi:hypothetical protein